jgi:hypothetical protein
MTAEKTVPRATASLPADPRQHDGYDQRNLDDSYGDREEDGTKRLSQSQCENLGVMNGSEDGAAEQDACEYQHDPGVRGYEPEELEHKQQACGNGRSPSPDRGGIVRIACHAGSLLARPVITVV